LDHTTQTKLIVVRPGGVCEGGGGGGGEGGGEGGAVEVG